jgi:hypothetical protein
MQDIELTRTGDNTYDWTLNGTDLQTVIGDLQLHGATTHAVLLKPEELRQNNYLEKGCQAHNMIRATGGESNIAFIEQSIVGVCKEIDGVYDARCTVELGDDGLAITELILIKVNGEEVLLNDF